MDLKGEIQGRGSHGELFQIPTGSEYIDFLCEEVQFEVIYEVQGICIGIL